MRLNLRLPGAVRMTDPGSYDETRVQSLVGEGATPTREIPRVQTPSEPVEWQDSMPTSSGRFRTRRQLSDGPPIVSRGRSNLLKGNTEILGLPRCPTIGSVTRRLSAPG